ncbi:hypothetical protein L2E82_28288 [Cichorium intybus]|uniref:Uncharacterized protein n=1 Tax=Cichorium intybus TaxID=13427 RepID=A0ACB9CVH7_CICIN|nr:hypothetical protein L2E82_28288 [Cichorium intybus]
MRILEQNGGLAGLDGRVLGGGLAGMRVAAGPVQYWDTPEWKKLSASGTKNRNSSDGSGKTGRHTGGSIGMNEHLDRLRLMLGREPTWEEVYLQTRLTAESKARYFAGDHTNLQFLSKKAEDSYYDYKRAETEKYLEEADRPAIGDANLLRTVAAGGTNVA